MGKPKKFYFLEVVNGTGRHLRYGQRGGGHFTSEKAALERQEYIKRQGVESILYVSDTNWEVVNDNSSDPFATY